MNADNHAAADEEVVIKALAIGPADLFELSDRADLDLVRTAAAAHALLERGALVLRDRAYDLPERAVMSLLAAGPLSAAEVALRLSMPDPAVRLILRGLLGRDRAEECDGVWRLVRRRPGVALANLARSSAGIAAALELKAAAGAPFRLGGR